ncbi:MAG: tetratricopeptide repeat protein [Planctomycetota bacterium]
MRRSPLSRRHFAFLFALPLSLGLLVCPAAAEGDGQEDLDKATELKIGAEGLRDLNEVIELLDDAIEKGLDAENQDFAESMLAATLLQRATGLAGAVLGKPVADPRRDPRWVQVRQFALTDLQRVVEIDDKLVEAHLLIGRLQSLPLGDPNAARRSLTKVVNADDIEPEQLAQAYALRGATQTDEDKQAADFSMAIELQPEKAEYYLLRSQAALKREDFDAGLADLDKIIELEPAKPQYYLLRSRANQQKEDFDSALADAKQAGEMATEPAQQAAALQQQGMVLRAQGKNDEAIAAFDKAAELAPESVPSYQLLGELYQKQGDLDKAVEQLTRAIELAPDDIASRMMRADLYNRQARYGDALADVEAALARQPGLLQGHLMRTALLSQLGRESEAVTALEQLVKAAPDQPSIHMQLAGLYMDLGESDKAIDSLTQVLDLAGENQGVLRMRGDMYLAIGKHEQALADFTKSFELNPEDAGLLNNYAWTLATSPFDNLRDGKRAIELATKAAELTDFQAAHILSTLAAAYAEAGDFEKAIEWSEKAVKAHANDAQKTRDMTADLAAELESYKRKEPWRELQQDGTLTPGGDKPAEEKPAATPPPVPVRTLDF